MCEAPILPSALIHPSAWNKDSPKFAAICELRLLGFLRSSLSDDAYRAQHRACCRPSDLVDPKDVGELVDFVLRKILQVLVLKDVNTLPCQQVDVDRVEAGPLLEL